MQHFYQEIQGWFSFPNLYKEMVEKFNDAIFVEVGSWKGTSSSYMAVEIINSKKKIKFYCVDTWKGSEEHQDDKDVINDTLFNVFINNMKSVKEYYFPIKNNSKEASKLFEDNSIDFVFIDASHKYEDILNDIKCWLPKVKYGGIIAGHDYEYKSIKDAVAVYFSDIKVQENCWVHKVKEKQLYKFQKEIEIQQMNGYSNKKIIGFWHICMINNFMEIISEQLELMIKSELYGKAENIFAGCAGTIDELEKVKKLFSNYPKIKIISVAPVHNYEFSTLESIKYKSDTDNESYLFYIHTKGVSYPDNEGGIYWRDYMNYYNITRWKRCVSKLKEGYDTCGVKLIEKGVFPMHYSGNFWWANSNYVKTLPKIDTLNKEDRFSAEMWLCSKSPKAFSLCQKFVDYNTKGKFIPESDKKIIVHTLGFNLSSEIKETTRLLYEQNKQIDFIHVIVDLGFPLLNKDEIPEDIEKVKLLNTRENLNTADLYDSRFIAIKNTGVSQNWEMVRKQFNVSDNDILICADPDERPQTNEWIKAIKDVITEDNRIAWCSLLMKDQEPFLKNLNIPIVEIAGQRVYLMDKTISWAQGGFSGKFLNEIGGVPVPTGAPIYGWIETACCEKINQIGYKWAILVDYYVEHTECSPIYREWKTHITSNVKDGQIDFEIWLKQKKNN